MEHQKYKPRLEPRRIREAFEYFRKHLEEIHKEFVKEDPEYEAVYRSLDYYCLYMFNKLDEEFNEAEESVVKGGEEK